MEPVHHGQFSIAWFNLAQLIVRGEKEKALHLFRLLTHSLGDKAYALQVEGDMHWAFGDVVTAQSRYHQAARLYCKEARMRAAIGVYEHVLALQPKSVSIRTALLEVSLEACDEKRVFRELKSLFDDYKKHAVSADQLLQVYQALLATFDECVIRGIVPKPSKEECLVLLKNEAPDCYQLLTARISAQAQLHADSP